MGLDFDFTNGQTPLEVEEKEGLLITTISTRAELDEFEQQNIEEAVQWVLSRNFNASEILSEKFIRLLHKRMFSTVWSWAGEFRKTDKNLGIDKWQITAAIKTLCDDADYWISNGTYLPDEIAIRFKHRIVCIHCFSNGNGRHSRLMADIIINKIFKQSAFRWGSPLSSQEARAQYLSAIKAADNGQFNELIRFAKL